MLQELVCKPHCPATTCCSMCREESEALQQAGAPIKVGGMGSSLCTVLLIRCINVHILEYIFVPTLQLACFL